MDRLILEINGKNIMVQIVKDQHNLHRISVDSSFAGYYDTTGKDTNYMGNFTSEEIEFIENKIMNAIN